MQRHRYVKTIVVVAAATAYLSLSACATKMGGKPGKGDDPDDHRPSTAQTEIPLKVCPPGVQNAAGADFAILGKLPRTEGGAVTFEVCVPEDPGHPGKPKVTMCTNGTGTGNDCSKAAGHDMTFKSILDFPMVQLHGSTCVLLCAPPGFSLGGYSASCTLVCR
jgi:hypothetical protein